MRFSDLIDEVVDIVQDPKLGETRIKHLLNEGYEHSLFATSDPLPDLEKQATVTTVLDTAFTTLPSDYLRDLNWVYDATTDCRITLLGSLQLLKIKYPGLAKTGNIEHAAASLNKLYYQGIPSVKRELSINYFRKPTLLHNDRDEPDMLPSHLHRRLLVNYACKALFSRIEDGMDGKKVNTAFHDLEYKLAFSELELWIIPRASEPPTINDTVTDYLE